MVKAVVVLAVEPEHLHQLLLVDLDHQVLRDLGVELRSAVVERVYLLRELQLLQNRQLGIKFFEWKRLLKVVKVEFFFRDVDDPEVGAVTDYDTGIESSPEKVDRGQKIKAPLALRVALGDDLLDVLGVEAGQIDLGLEARLFLES